ncbi:MAG: glycosyltransferase family 4 protein [Candidatus Delongbacteria bacterium]|nr:glycosyltransferase family 4 protein [Candidatus Delongbacteria bacterium]
MKRKKILVVCHSAVTPFHLEKYKELSHDYDIWIIVPQITREEGIELHPVSRQINDHLHLIRTWFLFPKRIYIFFPVWFIVYLQRIKPDLLYIEEEDMSFCPVYCILMHRLLNHKSPIVIAISENIRFSPLFKFPRYLFYRLFSWFTLRCVDGALGINQGAEAILRSSGVKRVQRQSFYGINPAWLEIERNHQFSGILHFGFIGRLIPEKGLEWLLKTLQRADFPFVLDIVGYGPEREKLQQLRFNEGQIVNWKGHVPHDSLPEVTAEWDFLVIPSISTSRWKEQFGRVIIEALALEIPVLGSDCGSIPEVTGPCGRIVPENNESALLDALKRWNQSPDDLIPYRAIARDYVRAHFIHQVVAERTRSFFESLL